MDGHFQFNRLPFGLTNAPATFQRAMNTILHGLNWLDCLVYLDDIVVFAGTEHHQELDALLQRLDDAGLKLNAKKCQVLNESTRLLGREGISTDPEKVKVLRDWPPPRDVSDLRSFLGCAGYYRQFIPNFAEVTAPLCNLERKDTPFQWTAECQQSFNDIKERLTSAPRLAHPRFDQPFILDTDTCKVGLGAVLTQVQRRREGHRLRCKGAVQARKELQYHEKGALSDGVGTLLAFSAGEGVHGEVGAQSVEEAQKLQEPKGASRTLA